MDGLPSFTKTLQSPAVAEYKRQQDAVIAACQARGGSTPSVAASQPPSVAEPEELIKVSASEFLNNYVPGATGAKFAANPVRVVKWANRAKKKVTTEQGAHAKEAAKRMRCLALVSHNNMKAAMQDFVVANQHVLRRFRLTVSAHVATPDAAELCARTACTRAAHPSYGHWPTCSLRAHTSVAARTTPHHPPSPARAHTPWGCLSCLQGTASTMKMLRSVLGPDVEYGPTCSSGPLGGDAQCGQQIILEDLGGVIFFTDPLSPHPHAADIATLLRMCDIANVLHATNPTTAKALIPILRRVSHGEAFLVPSMTETLHWFARTRALIRTDRPLSLRRPPSPQPSLAFSAPRLRWH